MYSIDHPWIAEREATVCTWKFDYDRGYVSNMNVSLLNDFMSLSARQLRDYGKTDWPWTMFDPEAKQRRHETVFPQECERAFAMGAALAGGVSE